MLLLKSLRLCKKNAGASNFQSTATISRCHSLMHAVLLINTRSRFSLSMEMSRLTRDGTAEPVS